MINDPLYGPPPKLLGSGLEQNVSLQSIRRAVALVVLASSSVLTKEHQVSSGKSGHKRQRFPDLVDDKCESDLI